MDIKGVVLHSMGRLFDHWLKRFTPGERAYVLAKLAASVHARLSTEQKFAQLGALANDLGIASCSAQGALGFIEGSVHDRMVIGSYVLHQTYNPSFQSLLIDRIFRADRGTYIDIGANVGLTIIPLARSRPNVRCYALEPEPNNFLFLRKNIAANDVEGHVTAFNLAAFSLDGTLAFELSANNMGDHRVRTALGSTQQGALFSEDQRQVIKVRAGRLDALLSVESLERPLMVKVDTQGSEVHVFRGGTELFQYADYIYTEFCPYMIRRVGDSPEEYLEMLTAFGFSSGWIEGENFSNTETPVLKRVESVIDDLRQLARQSKLQEYTNVFLSRHQETGARMHDISRNF